MRCHTCVCVCVKTRYWFSHSLCTVQRDGWQTSFFYWLACCGWLVDEMETELVMWPAILSLIPFRFLFFFFKESLQHQELRAGVKKPQKTGGYGSGTHTAVVSGILNYWSGLTFYVWMRNISEKSGLIFRCLSSLFFWGFGCTNSRAELWARWEDRCHAHIWKLNKELQPAAG